MFLNEIAARLVDQGVGALGVNIFASSAAVIPPSNGPFLTLSEVGGLKPTRVQNQASAKTQRPTAQVLVRGIPEPVVRAMIAAAYVALDGIYNTTLAGTFYISVEARQEPADMGLDADGRVQFVFNIDAEKAPS